MRHAVNLIYIQQLSTVEEKKPFIMDMKLDEKMFFFYIFFSQI